MPETKVEYELWHKAKNATAWSKSAKPAASIHEARARAKQIRLQWGFVSKCYKVTKEEIDL